jgi:DNA repair photolyase
MSKLGELYIPTGKARETAAQVLEVSHPMAVNIAYGCTNCCAYPCYIPYIEPGKMRFPKISPQVQILKQLDEMKERPEGVFLSFATDPFLKENWEETVKVLHMLTMEQNIPAATLSKKAMSSYKGVRHGMTIVSLDNQFAAKYEKNAAMPTERLNLLRIANRNDEYTWISMEPYPTPEKVRQNICHFLEALNFVDFMIFGKWNYDATTSTPEAKAFYQDAVAEFRDFCKSHGIRHYVKKETLNFIQEKVS